MKSKTQTILDSIIASKREEVGRLVLFEAAFKKQAIEADPPRRFSEALRKESHVSVIAEFKRASPSAGDINPYAQAGGVSSVYAASGASAISVLTDERYFKGSLDDLRAARQATNIAVLRKDFMLAPVQLYEARAAGADAILLIVKALTERQLRDLLEVSSELAMTALVEIYDEAELETALGCGATTIGVNARDLRSFEVDLGRALRLIESLPPSVTAVAESGIGSKEDVMAAGAAGADAVLVGSWLMKGDPGGVEALVGHPKRERRGS